MNETRAGRKRSHAARQGGPAILAMHVPQVGLGEAGRGPGPMSATTLRARLALLQPREPKEQAHAAGRS